MSARYRLTYFNGRARAELIRLIFHTSGEEFEDNRIDTASWQQLKPNTPFGALPILEFDGKVLAQSLAIARYLAREFGLAGKSRYEEAVVDSVVDTSNDILGDIIKIIFNEDDKLKKENSKKFIESIFPFTLNSLENMFHKHGQNSGYAVGPDLTYADLAIFNALDQAVQAGIVKWDYFDRYKNISRLLALLENTPRLAGYLKTRPHTPY
jgi:glutathione S-transferase